jgi:hypothetical protein
MLLVDIGILVLYFSMMYLLMLVSQVFLEPIYLMATIIHIIVDILCMISFIGVILAFVGQLPRHLRSILKWLLITLAVLGMLSYPIGCLYDVRNHPNMEQTLFYL